jgi:hypothetical protein
VRPSCRSASPRGRPGTIGSTGFNFITWSIAPTLYVLPHLRGQKRAEAMRPLLLLHSFRFVGLAFLVPGVVSPDLPAAWARRAAYGDIVHRCRNSRLGGVRRAQEQVGNGPGVAIQRLGFSGPSLCVLSRQPAGLEPGQLGAGDFIVTVLVPLLLVTHGLVFWLLLRGDTGTAEPIHRAMA